MRFKFVCISILIVALMGVGFTRLWNLQITQGALYLSTSYDYRARSTSLQAPRGLIRDRNDMILANNQLSYNIYFNYNFDTSKLQTIIALLEENNILSFFEPVEYIKELLQAQQREPVAIHVTPQELQQIQRTLSDYKDLVVAEPVTIRSYPYEELYAHTIGYTQQATAEDIALGIEPGSYVGKYQVEALWDSYLQGVTGRETVLDGNKITVPPEVGATVHTFLNHTWQEQLYNLLVEYDARHKGVGAAGGAAVVIDAQTGEIHALVSYPGFDPHVFIEGVSQDQFNTLTYQRERPLIDKAVGQAAAPGSIFKLISSFALLEAGTVSRFSTYFSNSCVLLGDREFCEFGKNFYGTMDITRALTVSSNLFFCHYMRDLAKTNSIDPFVRAAKQFGIGEKSSMSASNVASGNMDGPENKRVRTGETWFPGDTCNAAIGQGAILTTPLQMAQVVAGIENGGTIYRPRLVDTVVSSRGEVFVDTEIEKEHQFFMSQDTRDIILGGMRSVAVDYESAVAQFLRDIPYNVKAKTGSAEVVETLDSGGFAERTHSWIVGSFEKDNTTFAFAFFQQYGGGGFHIAPMVRDFLMSID